MGISPSIGPHTKLPPLGPSTSYQNALKTLQLSFLVFFGVTWLTRIYEGHIKLGILP